MNIAVLFTGQIRPNDTIVENIKFLFSNFNDVHIDYFCTTWYQSDVDYKSIERLFDFKIFDIETYNQYTTQFIKDYDNYEDHCKTYKSDDAIYNIRSETDRLNGVWKNVPIIFYKLQRGIKLIEKYQLTNRIKYDLVVRIRWDLKFYTPFDVESIKTTVENNLLGVYVHSIDEYKRYASMFPVQNDNFSYHQYVDGWVDETLYYGSLSSIKNFSNIYDEYYNICKDTNCWIVHVILKEYIKRSNIKIIMPHVIIGFKDMIIYHYYHNISE